MGDATMMGRGCAPVIVTLTLSCALAAAGAAPQAQRPTVDDVVARASAYVADYQKRFLTIVADEEYDQRLLTTVGSSLGATARFRRMRSDLVMVQTKNGAWLPYRDVYEVDGKPVRDRQERLLKLLLDGSVSDEEQITRLVDDSARYNLGAVHRTVNLPTLGLFLVHPARVRRSQFSLEAMVRGARGTVAVVKFQERDSPSLVTRSDQRDLFSSGRLWIAIDDGHIERTQMEIDEGSVSAVITVHYRLEPALDLWMPVEMRESYLGRAGTRIDTTAKYSKFRRFAITVQEKVGP